MGEFSVDEDHLSIAVGPLESLEATACTPPPWEPSVAAETAPAEELYEPDSHQKNFSQTGREMGPPDNPPARRVVVEALTLGNMSGVKLTEWNDIQAGRVVLDIGGTRFTTSKTTMRADPGSLLCAMIRQGSPMRPWMVEDGTPIYLLDRDPSHFRHILNYLRLGSMLSINSLPREVRYLHDLKAEADNFNLVGLNSTIERRINILCVMISHYFELLYLFRIQHFCQFVTIKA